MKNGILNYTKDETVKIFESMGIARFRAEQILIWLYRFGKLSFLDMTNIGKSLQKQLDEMFYIYRPSILSVLKSIDGTTKFLLELQDGNTIECVFIPEEKRNTICISSQVGCLVGCKFCNTGHNGFVRNLSTEEIISQFLTVKDYLKLWGGEDRLSNVVFMGMGEPLFNYVNVLKAIKNLMVDEAEGLSRRKITVSTSGISPILTKIAKYLPCRLAVSLHASNDLIRSKIMPINDMYNIESLLAACRIYTEHHEYLKITFEYLLLDNINDSKECAYELLILLKGINAKINLLQLNSWDGCYFVPTSQEKLQQFANILNDGGLNAYIRARRGEDIMAACGQLMSKFKEKPAPSLLR